MRGIHEGMSQKTYTPGQSWAALRKCWTGYRIAKTQKDATKQKEYAERIRRLQGDLGLKLATFPDLGLN